MKLVIENARLLNSERQPVANADGSITRYAEVMFMGGKVTVENPKSIPNGDYNMISVEAELVPQAKSWQSKDRRSGNLIAQEVRFGDVIEVSPLKK